MNAPGSKGTILLVTHAYPPRPSSGSARPRGLAIGLRRLGYRVVVLTSGAWGSDFHGDGSEDVHRTRDLLASPLNWRRENMAAHEGRAQHPYTARRSRVTNLLVPDIPLASWIPFALPRARRFARRLEIDCVITTSGPESTHLIGMRLRADGFPWVAELRDGWRFEPYRSWSSNAQERLDAWLEASVLRRADAVVTVSEPITEDVRRRFGIPATTIPNGFDPNEHRAKPGIAIDPERHTLVYTGSLAPAGRTLQHLLDALRLLGERSPETLNRFELIVAGPLTGDEERMIAGVPSSGAVVRHVGVLGRDEALGLQAEADSLLVVTAGIRTGEMTSKLFEYLGTANPILVLGEGTEAARTVESLRAGTAVPGDDPERIAEVLESFVAGKPPGFDPAVLAESRMRFSFERMAEQTAEVVELARERRRPAS